MYQLVDSGNLQKLEKIGPYLIIRPAPQAIWEADKSDTLWKRADAIYTRNQSGSGKWQFLKKLPTEFIIDFLTIKLKIKFTGFGHLGLFPEHAENLKWLAKQTKKQETKIQVLNLFAYTGLTTIALAQQNNFVTHLDAAKGVVDWAKENAKLSNTDNNIRWIVDDVNKFIQKEIRRKKTYDAIILDPPSFGRGPKNEMWKIEEHLSTLLKDIQKLFSTNFQFMLLSGHSPFFTPVLLENLLKEVINIKGKFESHEMLISQDGSRKPLPSGSCVKWSRE